MIPKKVIYNSDYIINLKGDNWKSCNSFRESIYSSDNSLSDEMVISIVSSLDITYNSYQS